jgi:hypothetical protein
VEKRIDQSLLPCFRPHDVSLVLGFEIDFAVMHELYFEDGVRIPTCEQRYSGDEPFKCFTEYYEKAI